MILKNMTNLLKGTYKEHGTNELLKRIKGILNIDLTFLSDKKIAIRFNESELKIINQENKVKYIIEFEEFEGYRFAIFTTEYKDYKTIKNYNQNSEIIKKSTVFKTKDNKILVLDEFDDGGIKFRRIVKTTKDDKDFNKGSFAKEQILYNSYNAKEVYKDFSDKKGNINTEKIIDLPTNLYIYFFQTRNNENNIFCQGYIETSCCIDKPRIMIGGRVPEGHSLILKSLQTPFPNIFIMSRETSLTEELKLNITAYDLSIYKNGDKLQIFLEKASLIDQNSQPIEYLIQSNTEGALTISDIDLLTEFFKENIIDSFVTDIIAELEKIKEQIQIKKKEKSRELDFFDLKMSILENFEELAFDIYENLSFYEEKINQLINKKKDDGGKTKLKV